LIPGVYRVGVLVTGPHKSGTAATNITVKPEQKENRPPVAIIKPNTLTVKQDLVGILNGAG